MRRIDVPARGESVTGERDGECSAGRAGTQVQSRIINRDEIRVVPIPGAGLAAAGNILRSRQPQVCRGRNRGRVSFKSPGVRRSVVAQEPALVCISDYQRVREAARDTAGLQRMRHQRTAVIGERVEQGIGIQ